MREFASLLGVFILTAFLYCLLICNPFPFLIQDENSMEPTLTGVLV